MAGKPDDLEAVRKIVEALQGFDSTDQERILRWVREKVGLTVGAGPHAALSPTSTVLPPALPPIAITSQTRDLRAFVAAKAPTSDIQFAATVAYYYRFEAPESERKEAVNAEDLLEACRMAGRTRLRNPGQTLRNAHRDGLLDRADRGAFSINAVGENLVAMTLPAGVSSQVRSQSRRPQKKETKKKGR